jgi:hypothetical protein
MIARPLGGFRYPWARSSAWIEDFSWTDNITALSGGLI